MKKTVWTLVIAVVMGLGLASAAGQPEEMDPLLEILVENKVITQAQAVAVQAEYARRKATQAAQIEEKVDASLQAVRKETKLPSALEGLKVGGLFYLSYQNGTKYAGVPGETTSYSTFTLKRGYLNVQKRITPHFSARFTPDIHQDSSGDWKPRMKYLYGKFAWKGNAVIGKPYVEFGLIHMPWLDFEEHVNRYRMQDTMFMERNHLFNSADVGVMLGGNFGGELPDSYKKEVNSHYAGRYGSFQVGVYNGTGYHAKEKNQNKVFEGRVSYRPFPGSLPGLQVSAFGVVGKGNVSESPGTDLPDWTVFNTMVSYESRYWVATGQYYSGRGNQGGTAVDVNGEDLGRTGYAFFTELRLPRNPKLSFIGRYDRFDPNRDDPESDVTRRFIVGVAWQMTKGNYWLMDYQTLRHRDNAVPDENRAQLTLQVKF